VVLKQAQVTIKVASTTREILRDSMMLSLIVMPLASFHREATALNMSMTIPIRIGVILSGR